MVLNNNNNDTSCKCTTPEYEIVLNEQGPQGRQGKKGDAGFTPIISVKDNTASNYTLNILTQDGQITTPNLKANLPAGGATGQVLTKNSGEQDDCSWQNLPNATTEVEGIARLATEADFEATEDSAASDNTIVTPALFNSEFKNKSAKFVTTDTEQAITGQKNFYKVIKTSEGIQLRGAISARDAKNGVNPDIIQYYNGSGDIVLGEINKYPTDDDTMKNVGIQIRQNNLDNDAGLYSCRDNNKYLILDTNNLKAGNNVSFNIDYKGLTINSTGGTGGATDYTELTNKPQINGVELTGNKNGDDLGLQNKLTAGTNITIEDNVISATGGGEIPTNVVTTDTVQDITGQKTFKRGIAISDRTATSGNRVNIVNSSITLSPNSGNSTTLNPDKLILRGGLDDSGLTLQSLSQLVIFGQQNTPMRIYASQLEKYSNINDNGAIILDTKNYNTYSNLSVNTLLKVDVTGLSTAITTGTTQNLLDLISLTGSATNVVTTANIDASNYNLTGGILKLPYMPTVNNKYINAYCDYNIDVRITGTIDGSVNTAREFNIELQRASDNSIVETHNVTKTNTNDLTGKGVVFSTYTNTSSDPFIANGLKLVLNNTSGQTVSITGVTLLVKGRTY